MSYTSISRVRTRSASPTTDTMEKVGIQNVADATYGPYETSNKNESMSDVVTPGYRNIIRRGGIVNNPCEYYLTERSSAGSGYQHFSLSGYIWEHTGAVTVHYLNDLNVGAPTLSVDDGSGEAKLRAIAALDATPYAFGEDVGEIGETLRFLRRPMTSLHRLSKEYRRDINKLRRKKKLHNSETAKLARAHADAWLEYRFAVSPLVRSASDLLESLDNMPKRPPVRLTARGFSHNSASNADKPQYNKNGTLLEFERSISATRSDRASILYTVSNPVYDWRWRYGLRNKDIPEVIWQLIPYSFMVDRMYDVSSAVRAVTNLSDPSLSILAASHVKKYESILQRKHTRHIRSGLTYSGSGENVTDRTFQYIRNTWKPSLSDAVPDVKPRGLVDDATKIADLTALVLSNFRR